MYVRSANFADSPEHSARAADIGTCCVDSMTRAGLLIRLLTLLGVMAGVASDSERVLLNAARAGDRSP